MQDLSEFVLSLPPFFLLFLFSHFVVRDKTQGISHARRTFYHWATPPAPNYFLQLPAKLQLSPNRKSN
jgi:hypothetical protein